MKICLTRNKRGVVYYYVDGDRVDGVPDCIRGDLTDIRGDLSGITGNLSGISGDIDDAGLTDDDRERGVRVDDLLMDEEIGGSDGKEI